MHKSALELIALLLLAAPLQPQAEAAPPPAPRRLTAGQLLGPGEDGFWAELEGTVTAVSEQATGLDLELTAAASRARVRVTDSRCLSPRLLLNSRLRCVGVCRSAWTLDGQQVAGVLTVAGYEQVQILELAPELWSAYPVMTISNLLRAQSEAADQALIHVGGRIEAVGPGASLAVTDGTERVVVAAAQGGPRTVGVRVEVLGSRARQGPHTILECGFCREVVEDGQPVLPAVLTAAGQIKLLRREEALRAYPVRIRGVITCVEPEFQAVVIQDATSGVYVKNCPFPASGPARVGEYWEIEGVTDAGFAPMVQPRRLTRLGEGVFPAPVHPTWDQLLNGSLDTQYVELQGIVSLVQPNGVMLLTRDGVIKVGLPGLSAEALRPYENSLVCLRGCLFARHEDEKVALQVKTGGIELRNPLITVTEPAPAHLFATPLKRAPELLLFDPRAGAFQRVKVSGQVIEVREGVGFLMDGTNGLRFMPKAPAGLQVSDLVEIVGFPELGGPSPRLCEVVARKLGQAPLPAARRLDSNDLLRNGYDSTRVRVEAVLVNLADKGPEQVLELQAGVRKFVARLTAKSKVLTALPLGSRLELTGTYVGQGGSRATGRGLETFELLLHSPADLQVLALPPWWTFRRLLAILGALVGVLVVALVWITLLRRQVEQRSVQLQQEIQDRERAEQQHVLEEERSRIARDLHDDLGSSLTEISMLAETGRDQPPAAEDPRHRFARILRRAQSLVRTLDEIVWAIDPRKDTLPALVRYLAGFAEEYLSAAGLACCVELPAAIPENPLAARMRHQLFLGVKEALHNVVRHAAASEVVFRLCLTADELNIIITDNGRGFDPATPAAGDGRVNLHQRLAGLRGRCEITSRVGAGTTVLLALPVAEDVHSL